jgi:hypothetical protein
MSAMVLLGVYAVSVNPASAGETVENCTEFFSCDPILHRQRGFDDAVFAVL